MLKKIFIFSDFLPNPTNCVVPYTFLFLFSDTSSCLHPLQPSSSSFFPLPCLIPCVTFSPQVIPFFHFFFMYFIYIFFFFTINPQSYPSLLSFVEAPFIHLLFLSFLFSFVLLFPALFPSVLVSHFLYVSCFFVSNLIFVFVSSFLVFFLGAAELWGSCHCKEDTLNAVPHWGNWKCSGKKSVSCCITHVHLVMSLF